jgi:tartrate dehydratase beta subunit/fumarate hydratase class I family protein
MAKNQSHKDNPGKCTDIEMDLTDYVMGGAAVLLAQHIKKAEVIAYEDLGTEAVRRIEVEDFPLIVINDIYGKDLYEIGVKQYARA